MLESERVYICRLRLCFHAFSIRNGSEGCFPILPAAGADLHWLYRYSIRRPYTVVSLAALLTLGLSPGVLRLKLRTDGHALIPTGAPEIRHEQSIRERFGLDDPVVVFIRSPHSDGIFNVGTLNLVEALTTALSNLQDVRPASLFSLATEHSDKVFSGTLRFRRLLEPMPQTAKELADVRQFLDDVRLYNGTLRSADNTSTAVMVGVPPGANRAAFLAAVREVVAAQGPVPETMEIIGAPVAEALLGTHILEDLGVPTSLMGFHSTRDADAAAWPRGLSEIGPWIAQRVGLVPVAIGIMALVFFLRFRSVTATALPLMEVGACLIVVFSVMGWLGVPLYLTTTVMPIILTATGVTDEIHVFSRYRHQLRERPGEHHVAVLLSTMQEMTRPVVMASITTAIGFLSFAVSSIAPVRAFGLFTALGILFCMIWSLSVIPAMLTLVHPRRFVRRREARLASPSVTLSEGKGLAADETLRSAQHGVFALLGRAVLRGRWAVILAVIALLAAAPFGIRRIVVQDSWIDGFSEGSDFRRATDAFNEQFLGTHILHVCLDGGHEWISGRIGGNAVDVRSVKLPWYFADDPQSLIGRKLRLTRVDDTSVGPPSRAEELQRTWATWIQGARRLGDEVIVSGDPRHGSAAFALRSKEQAVIRYDITTSPLIRSAATRKISELETFLEGHRAEAVGGVLGTADYVATVNYLSRGRKEADRSIPANVERIEWLWGEYERIRGIDRRRQLIDDEYGRCIVTVFMKNANFVGTARLMKDIREYEERELRPLGMSLSFAGDVAVSQTLIDAIVSTQVASVVGSLAGDFLVTAILGRSLIFGLLCILPSSLAVLLNFAVMGGTSMPLGVATSMFSAMTLGIGVDYAIHLLERYRLLRSQGLGVRDGLVQAVGTTGSAIFVDTLAVCLGFGVMVFSQVPANARLGALLALSLTNCFLATLLVLPAILSLRRKSE